VTVQLSLGRTHAPSHPSQADIAVRVVGTTGWVTADEQKPALTVCGRPSSGLREILYDADSVQEFIDHFVWCILHDRTPVQTIADGAGLMEAVFAAEESARTGRVVRISSEGSPSTSR